MRLLSRNPKPRSTKLTALELPGLALRCARRVVPPAHHRTDGQDRQERGRRKSLSRNPCPRARQSVRLERNRHLFGCRPGRLSAPRCCSRIWARIRGDRESGCRAGVCTGVLREAREISRPTGSFCVSPGRKTVCANSKTRPACRLPGSSIPVALGGVELSRIGRPVVDSFRARPLTSGAMSQYLWDRGFRSRGRWPHRQVSSIRNIRSRGRWRRELAGGVPHRRDNSCRRRVRHAPDHGRSLPGCSRTTLCGLGSRWSPLWAPRRLDGLR